jgi:hypothetical protein
MFFQDHEKTIYSPEGSDMKFDPLALDRALVTASGGKLAELIEQWKSGSDDKGDVSASGKAERQIASALAEGELVKVARVAFKLGEFPVDLDAEALEYLCDFLEWMKKKGRRGETPPDSPGHSESNNGSTTTSSSSFSSISNAEKQSS